MAVHTIFTVITNLFGLNFYEQKVWLAFVLFLHFVGSFFIAFHILFSAYINNLKMKGIYVFADFVQLGIPFLIKNYLLYQAVRMADFDKRFNEKIEKIYKSSIIKKHEKNFLMYLLASISMTTVKLALTHTYNGIMYNSCQVLSALICAGSDFIVVYHLRCLSDHLKFVAQNMWNNKDEVYRIIELKHLIHRRFDFNLFLTISSYFLLMIIALFWVFMRIAFGFMTTAYGTAKESKVG